LARGRFVAAWVLIAKVNATTRLCFDRSIALSLILKSDRGAPKSFRLGVDQRCGRKRHSGTALADLGQLPPESARCRDHADQSEERNAFGSGLGVLFSPTVQPESVLASEPRVGWLLLHVVQEALL
jgi:hypothetical protein